MRALDSSELTSEDERDLIEILKQQARENGCRLSAQYLLERADKRRSAADAAGMGDTPAQRDQRVQEACIRYLRLCYRQDPARMVEACGQLLEQTVALGPAGAAEALGVEIDDL